MLQGPGNAVILQSAQAYTALKRAHAQFKISLQAELNMKKQTGLQDYRVARGAAVGSDVLVRKTHLLRQPLAGLLLRVLRNEQ